MKRLGNKEKELIYELIRGGESLNAISKISGRGKSTLYYHYRKILPKKIKPVCIPFDEDLFIGELVGLFVGDGSLFYDKKTNNYVIRFFFNVTEKSFVDELSLLFENKLCKKPAVYRAKNVMVVRYYSKVLYDFIMSYVGWGVSLNSCGYNKKSRTVYLKDRFYSPEFKKGFLKGFLDSDGYFSPSKTTFDSSSCRIMEQTKNFLYDLGYSDFHFSFREDKRPNRVGMYKIYVRLSERKKLTLEINPRNRVNFVK